MMMLYVILRATGVTFLKSIWCWFDIIYIVLNLLINMVIIDEEIMDK